MGERLRRVFGSFTVLFQTERVTLNSLPSKLPHIRPRNSLLRSPVNAAVSTTLGQASSTAPEGLLRGVDGYLSLGALRAWRVSFDFDRSRLSWE